MADAEQLPPAATALGILTRLDDHLRQDRVLDVLKCQGNQR